MLNCDYLFKLCIYIYLNIMYLAFMNYTVLNLAMLTVLLLVIFINYPSWFYRSFEYHTISYQYVLCLKSLLKYYLEKLKEQYIEVTIKLSI